MATEKRIRPPKAEYRAKDSFLQMAIEEARKGIYNGDGGPFGCVIVKDGVVVGKGHNCVLKKKDSTCHGEIEAIRDAEKKLNTHDLSGCVVYTTGEPCAMCLTACMWANVKHIYYGCTIKDNSVIGFRDERFDELLGGREKMRDYLNEIDREACLRLFAEYQTLNPTKY